jgi:hypothetical protein
MWQLASHEEAVRAVRAPAADWLGRQVSQHHNWLVEKTPASSHAARAIVEVFPRARFIHVVRDPRDVIASRLHPPASRHAAARWRRRLAIGTWSARWVRTLKVMSEAAGFAPVAQIHYESLVSRPRETCRELFDFCEIPCDEAELSDITHRNRLEAHTRRGPGLFRGQGRVGGWRSKLSRGDEAIVRAMAGPEMAAHGYIAQPGLPYAARRAARPVIRLVRERS